MGTEVGTQTSRVSMLQGKLAACITDLNRWPGVRNQRRESKPELRRLQTGPPRGSPKHYNSKHQFRSSKTSLAASITALRCSWVLHVILNTAHIMIPT